MFSPTRLLLLAATAVSVTSAEDKYYEFTIQSHLSMPPMSPDCFNDRDLMLVDGQFPGPTIQANIGDTVHIKWHNYHPSEGVSIHYHGMLMQDQPYADGTSGITTCVVGPMQTFEQKFVADNAGTHYWHGHTSLDRMDGLQGLIIIEDPDDLSEQALKEMYDEERVLFLQDWYHKSGSSLRNTLDANAWIGFPQSILINGKGRFDPCVADPTLPQCDEAGCGVEDYVPAIPVEAGKTYLFRVINAGGLMSLNLAFANHTMTVVKADGNFVEEFDVTSLEISPAQRYSVLVTTDQDPNLSYWLSAFTRFGSGYAYLQYNNSTAPDENSTMPVHDMNGFALDQMLVSKDVSTHSNADILNLTADRSSVIVSTQSMHPATGRVRYTSNNVSNSLHTPKPLAAVAYETIVKDDAAAKWPDVSIPGTVLVPDVPPMVWNYSNTPRDENVSGVHTEHGYAVVQYTKGDVVDMVFQNVVGNRGSAGSHAWHLHGHEFYVIGQGMGTYKSEDASSFNLNNPVLRDTFSVWNLGWTAIRFKADNPGVWPFHCTMAPHAVTAMGFNVITSPELMGAPPPGLTSCAMTSVDPEDAQVCMSESEIANLTTMGQETEISRTSEKLGVDDTKADAEESTVSSAGTAWSLSMFGTILSIVRYMME